LGAGVRGIASAPVPTQQGVPMKRIVLALLVVLVAAFVPGFAAAGPALPMPTDDHGMFLNILPAGQGTTTTSQDAIQYESTGTAPAHDVDQESMYSSLRLARNLQDSDLSKYYKPETFLPPTGTDLTSTESPEQGLSILR